MALDRSALAPGSIAIIGGGISGLAAAYLLSPLYRVTLYEAEPRLGGHARTVLAGKSGNQPVDTGFIVFNYANYPHLTGMFRDLDVPVVRSDMSFGISIDDGRLEYGLRDLRALFAQRRNLFRPEFHRMIRDIFRFNKLAEGWTESRDGTIAEMVAELRLGESFMNHYLLPVSGAIWSSTPKQMLEFPARSVVRFFRNHGLLSHKDQHQWWTVEGGSVEYVRRLTQRLRSRGAQLHVSEPVQGVTRDAEGVHIHLKDCTATHDQVIFACHSDQALRLLTRPSGAENRLLGAMGYQDNRMVLHRDPGQMPANRACWSSWVYKAGKSGPDAGVGVTYWMNRLQNINEADPLFVTINPGKDIPDEAIYDQAMFRHPVFDTAAIDAQAQIGQIQGQDRTWFAGAYLRHGFHEDGFASAVRIARTLQENVSA